MPKKKKKALEPTLALGPLERLPHEKGTRVRIKLKPNKPAKYSAFQNITVVMRQSPCRRCGCGVAARKSSIHVCIRKESSASDQRCRPEKTVLRPSGRQRAHVMNI